MFVIGLYRPFVFVCMHVYIIKTRRADEILRAYQASADGRVRMREA
ncbi:hypothetical protein ESA_00335 [Cronobacter sakazakii ATCC BAA-894]|uniref:Uncharacterized protein n=1 Tax=Cronobacter sakazakii (strain ATCC BAA-894) TaxID=290339 RepID=A7MJV3_CROS8|nr:hypothetical protein ESA_00335 [Cronobacter sakazakii ATCC BAA-894]